MFLLRRTVVDLQDALYNLDEGISWPLAVVVFSRESAALACLAGGQLELAPRFELAIDTGGSDWTALLH